tara:strand:- start:110 stop:415 length:306 start_codon:yes stop_codon:yes gene_type:complete
MAEKKSIKGMFDTNGSPLAVPASPNPNPVTDPVISVEGESLLHNQYSNIGDPTITTSPYTNAGLAAAGYTPPQPSTLGQSANLYQSETNRYSNNAPEERAI